MNCVVYECLARIIIATININTVFGMNIIDCEPHLPTVDYIIDGPIHYDFEHMKANTFPGVANVCCLLGERRKFFDLLCYCLNESHRILNKSRF